MTKPSAWHIADYDSALLRLLELSPFERRRRGGGWRFGTKVISNEIVLRLTASGRARIEGNFLVKEQPVPVGAGS
jgi:hypothetical protein